MDIVCSAKLEGEFSGWSGHTLFSFTNGQYWVQSKYAYYYHYLYRPQAKVVRENGIFYLQVDGVQKTVPVRQVTDIIQSTIKSDFKGWSGHSRFELVNGQIWEQAEYAYSYHYAYRPVATIYNDSGTYRLSVDGMSESISVRRIK